MKTLQITTTPNVRQAIVIPDTPITGYDLVIFNETHGSSKYISIGDSTVTLANGVHIYGLETLQLRIGVGEVLHIISADAVDVRLLATLTD
jgi:hypothetical protein